MKFKFTLIGFILGVLTMMFLYSFLGGSIQEEVAILEYEVGTKVHRLGEKLQEAGNGMLN